MRSDISGQRQKISRANRPPESKAEKDQTPIRILIAAIACITLIIAIAIRIRLLGIPLERDEGEYAYAGQLMLQGIPSYKLAYSMKFPGTATCYALMMSIFGQTIIGIHIGLLLVNVTTVVLIFFLGRRLLDPTAGFVAAATYSVLSTGPYILGLASHATHFVLLPVLAGVLILIRDGARRTALGIFFSGLLFGLGLLMKQSAIFLISFGATYLLFRDIRDRLGLKTAVLRNLIFGSAAMFPLGVICLLLYSANVFGKFWFWTIDYARQYVSEDSLLKAGENFISSVPGVIGSNWTLWALAGIGLLVGLSSRRTRATTYFLSAFLAFSTVALASGPYFRNHYFILVLPALSLLAGVAVSNLCRFSGSYPGFVQATPILLLCGALGWPVYRTRTIFFRLSPVEVCQTIYSGNPFVEAISVAKYIHDRTNPADRIAVLGSEPEIYFYAQRHSATGYIYTYGLVEEQKYALKMQREMIDEIELSKPKYLIVVGIGASWLAQPDSHHPIFDWITDYTGQNYTPVGLVHLVSPERTDYYFDDIPKLPSGANNVIFVNKRKM